MIIIYRNTWMVCSSCWRWQGRNWNIPLDSSWHQWNIAVCFLSTTHL